jgi:tetratricopeptide (TPR) repeat protein
MSPEVEVPSPREEAQRLALKARQTDKSAQALELARQALALDGECTDAQVILAQAEHASPRLLARALRVVVERAEARLGAPFLREHRGRLASVPEAQPYLRARLALVIALEKAGRPTDAAMHLEGMLAMDPTDALGIRPRLICACLSAKRLKPLAVWMDEAKGDAKLGLFMAWAEVLMRLKAQDEKGARKSLERARGLNANVEGLLTGRCKAPRRLADVIEPGSIEEALATLKLFGEVWIGDREAMYWLFKQG